MSRFEVVSDLRSSVIAGFVGAGAGTGGAGGALGVQRLF